MTTATVIRCGTVAQLAALADLSRNLREGARDAAYVARCEDSSTDLRQEAATDAIGFRDAADALDDVLAWLRGAGR